MTPGDPLSPGFKRYYKQAKSPVGLLGTVTLCAEYRLREWTSSIRSVTPAGAQHEPIWGQTRYLGSRGFGLDLPRPLPAGAGRLQAIWGQTQCSFARLSGLDQQWQGCSTE